MLLVIFKLLDVVFNLAVGIGCGIALHSFALGVFCWAVLNSMDTINDNMSK